MPFAVGDLIDGHYRVERRFAGGMGYVYIVYDEVVGKRFAIKQLLEKHADNLVMVERFRREASAWLLLEYHPHIVQAHSYHPRPEGPILILEYVEGPSLARLLQIEQLLSPVQAVSYALQFCQGMHYAHTHVIPDRGVGVLHRDIKPGNILLTRSDQIKVTDFGLAKMEGDSKITGEGLFVGTVAYSPPEQLRGAELASRASDVYAFGTVLYQMLSGKPPFRGQSVAELCRTILHERPVGLGELCPDLHPVLVNAVMRCLEKDPAARFGTFEELGEALRGLEQSLGDQRDQVCSGCGFTTRRAVAKCPICSGRLKPGRSIAGADRRTGSWNLPVSVLIDPDAPLPVPPEVHGSITESAVTPLPISAGSVGGAEAEEAGVKALRDDELSTEWPVSDSQHYLVELRSHGKVLPWRLERSGYTVGRAPQMKIRLRDPAVAGYQLFLVWLPCGWVVINSHPQSPLEVNGCPTRQWLLRPWDLLRVGKTWMAYIGPPAAAEPLLPIPGHWPERVDPKGQTVSSGGSTQTRLGLQRAAACVLELPGRAKVVTQGEPLRIGRSPFCEVLLDDPAASPVEAMVAWQEDGPHMFNLTGGLVKQVGGGQITDHLLSDGELLQVGSTAMKVHIEGDPQLAASPQFSKQSGCERFALTVLTAPQKGQTATLPAGEPVVLGRHPACDVILAADGYVSRRHLELTAGESGIDLKDLGSRHGFFINQVAFSDTAVARPGDVLLVGKTALLVHYELELG